MRENKIVEIDHESEQNEWRVNFSTTHRYLALLTFVLNHSHAHANNFDTIKTQSYLFLKLVDQKKNIRQIVELCFDCFTLENIRLFLIFFRFDVVCRSSEEID